MHDLPLPQSEAKRRLLDAAQSLFAERGFEAVSVRDITRQAAANVAAVNYHFGTRDGLLALVVARHLNPINEERLARLDASERRWPAKTVPVEEILEAFTRPLITGVRRCELPQALACRLLGRILALSGDALPAAAAAGAAVSGERFQRALVRALPALGSEELVWRGHFMVGAMIHMLMSEEVLQRMAGEVAGLAALDAMFSRYMRFAVAGLREGMDLEIAAVKKGPQATFDF